MTSVDSRLLPHDHCSVTSLMKGHQQQSLSEYPTSSHCDRVIALDSQFGVRILRSKQISSHSPQRFHRSTGGSSLVRSKNAHFQLSIGSIQHIIHECTTDSRYFGFGYIRVSPVIGNRSCLRCSYGFPVSPLSPPLKLISNTRSLTIFSRPLRVVVP